MNINATKLHSSSSPMLVRIQTTSSLSILLNFGLFRILLATIHKTNYYSREREKRIKKQSRKKKEKKHKKTTEIPPF